jgi:hypothetical protein
VVRVRRVDESEWQRGKRESWREASERDKKRQRMPAKTGDRRKEGLGLPLGLSYRGYSLAPYGRVCVLSVCMVFFLGQVEPGSAERVRSAATWLTGRLSWRCYILFVGTTEYTVCHMVIGICWLFMCYYVSM